MSEIYNKSNKCKKKKPVYDVTPCNCYNKLNFLTLINRVSALTKHFLPHAPENTSNLPMSTLAEFRQDTIAALGMYKGDSCPVGAVARVFIDHPGTVGHQFGYGGLDVIHLIGQMVDAGAVFFDELCHRAVR